MSTFATVSIVVNIILILTVLWLVILKYTEESKIKKINRERKAKQVQNLKKAHFIKSIRTEVRKYLKELQK